jgi:hypothetical protein
MSGISGTAPMYAPPPTVSGQQPTGESTIDDGLRSARLAVYEEVCKSYHATDEFRAKLLGFLPLASLTGILLIGRSDVLATAAPTQGTPTAAAAESTALLGFVSFFAAAFTIALFLYEIRGILRCHDLIARGYEIEQALGLRGQFCVCTSAHSRSRQDGIFNAKVAASVIYSLVFAAWMFLGLHLGLGLNVPLCGVLATSVGLLLGVGACALVNKVVAS